MWTNCALIYNTVLPQKLVTFYTANGIFEFYFFPGFYSFFNTNSMLQKHTLHCERTSNAPALGVRQLFTT